MRKITDEQQAEGGRIRLSVPAIYDTIKRSNSSLNRKPKKLLEDSIERVLEVIKSDVLGDDESDSIEGDFEGLEDKSVVQVSRAVSILLDFHYYLPFVLFDHSADKKRTPMV